MKTILLIGATGFVGTAVVSELSRRLASADLRMPTRRRERCKHLSVIPNVRLLDADVHDPATLAQAMHGCDAVISMVGILQGDEPQAGEPYGRAFARAHAELPAKIAAAARAQGVRRVVHVSSLGAAVDAPSCYLRSKAAGEAALQAADLDLTIVKPSVIFGRGDSFLTLFAGMAALVPFFPLAGAEVRFQPVWVNDVANVVADCLERSESVGQVYELGGPTVYTLGELVRYATRVAGHPRPVIGLPDVLAQWQARAMELLPKPPMTRDNLRSMQIPSVCAEGVTLPFGRVATPLEAVAPSYLA
ncbi:MAG: complex I NDUFA9 subunit family protein [Rhodocyclaceae bacterium]|jgi:uncharacterized protein YbjT (DUF2867 family)|nr:complex I NDUFA9 subunit family protein [Rhodocyclaceae bacterium]MBK6908644.1 complex I NDUFA9 subunit family protein [Rhodocyclaceae bacterium]